MHFTLASGNGCSDRARRDRWTADIPAVRSPSSWPPHPLPLMTLVFANLMVGCSPVAKEPLPPAPVSLASTASAEPAEEFDTSSDQPLAGTNRTESSPSDADDELVLDSDLLIPESSDSDRRKIVRQSTKMLYDENGRLKRKYQVAESVSGERFDHGGSIEYSPNGKLYRAGRYRYGEREGLWFFNHRDGSRAKKGTYVEGKPDGEWRYYSNDGTLDRIENYNVRRPHGKWTTFYSDGTVKSETDFVAGKIDGISRYYYPSGQLKAAVSFKDGKEHGVTRRYFEHGERLTLEHFQHGQRHGRSTSWTADGEVAVDQMFEAGLEIPLPEGIGEVPPEDQLSGSDRSAGPPAQP